MSIYKAEWLRSLNDSSLSIFESDGAGDADVQDDVFEQLELPVEQSVRGRRARAAPPRPLVGMKNPTVEGLVEMWFSSIRPGSVTREMLASVQQKDTRSCTVLVVNNNSIYLPRKPLVKRFYNSRLFDLAWLIIQASYAEALPDVEMLVCPGDSGIEFLRGAPHFDEVPVLAPVTRFTKVGTIPVPMLARGGKSYWGNNQVRQMLQGEPPYPQVPWGKKKRVAFFRGKHAGKCDLSRVPHVKSHCFRDYLIKALRNDKMFDLSQDEWVPEGKFEDSMLLMIIGNSGGWSDRTMRSLFKSSPVLYVDQAAYEWFVPMLVDGVDFLKVEASYEAVRQRVHSALRDEAALRAMVSAANARAREIFNLESVVRYVALTIKAYAKTLAFTPRARKGMDIFTFGT